MLFDPAGSRASGAAEARGSHPLGQLLELHRRLLGVHFVELHLALVGEVGVELVLLDRVVFHVVLPLVCAASAQYGQRTDAAIAATLIACRTPATRLSAGSVLTTPRTGRCGSPPPSCRRERRRRAAC